MGQTAGAGGEAEDAKAARDGHRHNRGGRAEKLHAQPQDEEERLARWRAVVLELEPNAVGADLHPSQPAEGADSVAPMRKNQRRAPETSNGFHSPIGCASRSATA